MASLIQQSSLCFLYVTLSLYLFPSLTHTFKRTHSALCLALRVLLPVTKSLASDITHKSLLINRSPGTKLAFGHGRCSHSSLTAGRVRRLLMAAFLPPLPSSSLFTFFTLVFSLLPPNLSPH